jgi:ferrochelatase
MTRPARSGRTGLLLLNLGTPEAPDTPAVRRYLKQFLMDPRVVDLPAPARWALVHLVILPTRPSKSAEAYRKVWTAEGSPLLVHSLAFRDALRARLGAAWQVSLGMRYGRPSIQSALTELLDSKVDRIVAAPLFPQHSSAATGSALGALYRAAATLPNVPALSVLDAFYDDPGFLDAFAAVGRPQLEALRPDHVLFSFHGLPERHVRRSDETGRHCLSGESCCASMTESNRHCYRAQSFATARLLAARLGLAAGTWSVAFQSRLGRTPWIRPYTDVVIDELRARGARRVAVFCPAFVADCLETLEEVGLRLREQFRAAGGDELRLVPSLNDCEPWVEAFAARVAPFAAPARAFP